MTSIAGEMKESTIQTIINNDVDIDSGVQYRPIKDCKYEFVLTLIHMKGGGWGAASPPPTRNSLSYSISLEPSSSSVIQYLTGTEQQVLLKFNRK